MHAATIVKQSGDDAIQQTDKYNPFSVELVLNIDSRSRLSNNELAVSVNQKKLQKRLRRLIGQAISDFRMIADQDRIMVCMSGGKDSYALLDLLIQLKATAPIEFEIIAVNLDQKQPGFPEHVLPDYLKEQGVPFDIIEQDTYRVVTDLIPQGKTMCSLCSRLRRGILYGYAAKHGITKIALGHHREDIMETLFLNMFNQGSIKAMPPILKSDDGQHIVIRPLAYCAEKDLEKYAKLKKFPIIPCNLCGSQDNLQRRQIKKMLKEWEKYPVELKTFFAAFFMSLPHIWQTESYSTLRKSSPLQTHGLPTQSGQTVRIED